MNKNPKNSVFPLKVSAKSGRASLKKPGGSVIATARSIEKRGTPNLEKTLAERVRSNEHDDKISGEHVPVKKSDVVAAPSVSDESVNTNNGGNKEQGKNIIHEIEKEEDVIAPPNLSIPEPLKSSVQDEYLLEEQLTGESSVIDGNNLGILKAYSFAPAKIAAETVKDVDLSRKNADLETLITEIQSEPRLFHTDSEKSTVENGNGITEEITIPSNVELAVAIIEAARAHPEESVTSGIHEAAKQIMDAILTMAAKDLTKLSSPVLEQSKSKSN
ncbi:hypothetical protein KI387_016048, partial [Taxus chinensis]